jgi:hypothetical protein
MKKDEFLKTYYFTFQIVKQDNAQLVVITGVIERKSHKVIDTITTTLDIPSEDVWIEEGDGKMLIPVWDWATYLDPIKRFQLDYFVKRISIEKYFPLNITENGDIGEMYK